MKLGFISKYGEFESRVTGSSVDHSLQAVFKEKHFN